MIAELSREWLQKTISDIETMRDEMPFGLDEDGSNTLAALKLALAGMDGEPVAYLIERHADYEAYGKSRKVIDAKLYNPQKESFWSPGAKQHHTVTPLYAAPPAPVAVPDAFVIPESATLTNINQLCPLDVNLNQTDFATGWNECRQFALANNAMPPIVKGISAYCQGWNACRAAMQAEPVSQRYTLPDGWIKCSELMPEPHGETLLVWCEHAIQRGYYSGDNWWVIEGRWTPGKRVTHWMPLPAAPEQEV